MHVSDLKDGAALAVDSDATASATAPSMGLSRSRHQRATAASMPALPGAPGSARFLGMPPPGAGSPSLPVGQVLRSTSGQQPPPRGGCQSPTPSARMVSPGRMPPTGPRSSSGIGRTRTVANLGAGDSAGPSAVAMVSTMSGYGHSMSAPSSGSVGASFTGARRPGASARAPATPAAGAVPPMQSLASSCSSLPMASSASSAKLAQMLPQKLVERASVGTSNFCSIAAPAVPQLGNASPRQQRGRGS